MIKETVTMSHIDLDYRFIASLVGNTTRRLIFQNFHQLCIQGRWYTVKSGLVVIQDGYRSNRCWKTGTQYDEEKYLLDLEAQHSPLTEAIKSESNVSGREADINEREYG